jgi:methylenetetrahydrofolate reductase (NADPH)
MVLPALDRTRYELLPFGSAEREAEAAPHPLTLTVTCSPRQGVDNSLDTAVRLRGLGHAVILHVAARTVRGPDHLDAVLTRMAAAGIGDVFLIGGDSHEPLGPYASALELLPLLRAHALAPRTIGVAAYPEGHPLIDDATLLSALAHKDGQADYMTTQMCFDPAALLRWLAGVREAGIGMPAYVGVPGAVDRRRLLEISMRIGVGASIAFARKQHGMRRLLSRHMEIAERFNDAVATPQARRLGVAGLHYYSFNKLVATVAFAERRAPAQAEGPRRAESPR